jgi:hypothetical protein
MLLTLYGLPQAGKETDNAKDAAGSIPSFPPVNGLFAFSATATAPATTSLTFPSLFGPNSGVEPPPQPATVTVPILADEIIDDDDRGPTNNGHNNDKSNHSKLSAASVTTDAENNAALEPPTDDFTAALVANVHVYVIGDYYDVPPLKELALAKLLARVSSGWPTPTLAHVLELVTNMTRLDGDALHDVVLAAAVEHAPRLIAHAAFRQLLAAGGPFAARFIGRLVARHALDIAALHERATASAAADATKLAEAKSLQSEPLQQRMRRLKETLDSQTACRQCHTRFNCYVDLVADNVRCRMCHTRHAFS